MSGAVALRRQGTRASTITLGSTPTGLVNPMLCGGLFGFTDQNGAAAATAAAGAIKTFRLDDALTYTPMKTGSVDASHPTLGHSGTEAYDFTILDAELDAAFADGVLEVYTSLDYCPQDLGGSVAPSTVTPFNTGWYVGSSLAKPNNYATLAKRCADIVYHCTVTRGKNMPYWGVWNEPDGTFRMTGTTDADYFAMFSAVASAIRAACPTLKIAGPEASVADVAYLTAFLTYCRVNSVPLDALSYHELGGFSWGPARSKASIDQAIAAAAYTGPLDRIIGEWTATALANVKGFGGGGPWFGSSENLSINDQAAAFAATFLMEAQAAGITRAHFVASKMNLTDSYDSGAFSTQAAWVVGNVFKQWGKLGSGHIMPAAISGDPGLRALACSTTTDLTGTVRVLVSNRHYDRSKTYPVTIAAPVADGRATTLYVVDRAHSNQFDAGLGHASLETVPTPATLGGNVPLTLAPLSSALLEIAP